MSTAAVAGKPLLLLLLLLGASRQCAQPQYVPAAAAAAGAAAAADGRSPGRDNGHDGDCAGDAEATEAGRSFTEAVSAGRCSIAPAPPPVLSSTSESPEGDAPEPAHASPGGEQWDGDNGALLGDDEEWE